MTDTRFKALSAAGLNLASIIAKRKAQAERLGLGQTSRQRFEAEFKRLGGDSVDLRTTGADYFYTDTARAFGLWQAAERDMLERCIESAQSRKMPAAQCIYNMGVDRVIDKLKELLNEH